VVGRGGESQGGQGYLFASFILLLYHGEARKIWEVLEGCLLQSLMRNNQFIDILLGTQRRVINH
jgi:hypothetical protein